jgi:glutathione S-transferase
MERYKYLNHIAWVATELHKGVGGLFNSKLTPEAREAQKEVAKKKIGQLVKLLDDGRKLFLNGQQISAADIYAYIVLTWTHFHGVPLPREAAAFMDNVRAVPGVGAAHAKMEAAKSK